MEEYVKKKVCFSKVFLFASIISSIIFWMIGELLYGSLIQEVNSIVGVGIYFGVFGVSLLIGLFVAATIENIQVDGKGLIISLVVVAFFVCLGMLFEFLYELGGKKEIEVADNYIFVLDNSGSMEGNDPNQQRVAAVEQILTNKSGDFEYAVYTFGQTIECVREMKPLSEGKGNIMVEPMGGTPIAGVLETIRDDMENAILPYDSKTQIILLTDGVATDAGIFGWGINSSLRFFSKKGISISTVGLGSVDSNMLTKIADETGGMSMMISDVGQLASAMEAVIVVEESDRNLLSVREKVSSAWLYVLMRIVFISILGLIFVGIKLAVVNNVESQSIILVFSLGGSILAGVLLEVVLNLIGGSGSFIRLIAVLLIGITPAYVIKHSSHNTYGGMSEYGAYDDYGSYTGGNGGMRAY